MLAGPGQQRVKALKEIQSTATSPNALVPRKTVTPGRPSTRKRNLGPVTAAAQLLASSPMGQ